MSSNHQSFELLLLAILIGITSAGGCGSDGGGGPAASGTIDSAGGSVSVTTGPLAGSSITVPAGALSSAVTITIGAGSDLSFTNFALTGPAVAFGPNTTGFSSPVTIEIPYDPALIPAVSSETDVQVLFSDLTGSVTVLTGTVDTVNNTVTVTVTLLGTFQHS